MKKQLMTGLFTVLALTAVAQTFQEWRNPEINAVNRAPMHTNYFAFENADAAKKADKKQSTNYMTLNGTWKFNWVKDADSRPDLILRLPLKHIASYLQITPQSLSRIRASVKK